MKARWEICTISGHIQHHRHVEQSAGINHCGWSCIPLHSLDQQQHSVHMPCHEPTHPHMLSLVAIGQTRETAAFAVRLVHVHSDTDPGPALG